MWGTDTLYNLLLYRPMKTALLENMIRCNTQLWFLLTLFCVINIGNYVFGKVHPVVISLIGLTIGYAIYITNGEYIPDIIANTATGLTFFSIGYWMQGKENNKWIIRSAIIGYSVFIFWFHSPFVDMRINQCLVDRSGLDYLLWFPACFCGIIVLNSTCAWLVKICQFNFLRFIGRNAMLFLVVHVIPLYIIINVLNNVYHISSESSIGIASRIIGLFITIVIVCSYMLLKSRLLQIKK